MADLLINNTDHWMDSLDQETIDSRGLRECYEQRLKRGDVIDVSHDGKWPNHAHNGGKFLIFRAPFLSVKDAEEYTKPLVIDGKLISKRRYRMWIETVPQDKIDQIVEFVYMIKNMDELLLYGQDKLDEVV